MWSLAAIAGCGSVASTPDGGPGMARGPVQVTVVDPIGGAGPAVGATVVFIDPDGTLVKRVATDAAGAASADVLPGASVTSIVLQSARYELETITGVTPGDVLLIGDRNPDASSIGTVTVTYPVHTGAASYAVAYPCGVATSVGAATSVTLNFAQHCKVDPFEVVVTPRNTDDEPQAVTFKGDIPFVAGGSTAVTEGYRTFGPFTASYTNVTSTITDIAVTRWAPDVFGFSATASTQTPTATTTINFGVPGSAGAWIGTQLVRSAAVQSFRQKVPGSVRNYGLDVTATLLPWLARPSFDAATRRLVVAIDTTGTTTAKPDAVQVVASYRRASTSGGADTLFSWTVYAAEPADLTLPVLPEELSALAPGAADQVTVGAAMFEADTVAGYDAVRSQLDVTFRTYEDGQRRQLPASAVRVSSYPGATRQ
jgi:hypothetical protein